MQFQIEDINLLRGPDPKWVKGLPSPYNTFQPAKTFKELAELCPSWWRILARGCLSDTVVYGNGKFSFSIRLEHGRWRFRSSEGINGKRCLDRVTLEAELRKFEGSTAKDIEQLFRVIDWETNDIVARVSEQDREDPQTALWLNRLEELREQRQKQRLTHTTDLPQKPK